MSSEERALELHRVGLLVKTGEIPHRAAAILNFPGPPAELEKLIRVDVDAQSSSVAISMKSKDSGPAVDTVNAFAQATVDYYAELRSPVKVILLSEATALPNEPTGAFVTPPTKLGRTAIAGLLGLLFGLGIALATDRFDARLRNRQQVAHALGIPVFAEIPRSARVRPGPAGLAVLADPRGAVADGYGLLKSAILRSQREGVSPGRGGNESSGGQVVLVTSISEDHARMQVATNLAASVARDGVEVLVIEGDLRNPTLLHWFDVPDGAGVVDFLAAGGDSPLGRFIRRTELPGIRVITGGVEAGAHPAYWTSQLKPLIAKARLEAAVVIVPAPPLLVASEVFDLLPLADTVLVVAENGRVAPSAAKRAAELLARFPHPELGAVLVGADTETNRRTHRL